MSSDGARSIALWVLATIATLFFLRQASQLLIPIVIGVLISYALEPVVAWLERRRIPRVAGASVVLLAILGAVGWGAYSLKDEAISAMEALPDAARRAREMVMSQSGSGPAASLQRTAEELRGTQGSGGEGSGGQPGAAKPQEGSSQPSGMSGFVQRGIASVFALAGHVAVVVFLVFFLLLSRAQVKNRIVEISGPSRERQRLAATIVDEVNEQIQRFLLVRLVTAVVVGVATWGVLALMGVKNAAVWGALAGVFNSIPYFGPVIVSGGLLVVGLVQGGGMSQALQMSGAALVITSIEGWLLTPPLMGKAERMSVLVIFLGLLLWTWIWGAWGTILAVPMLVVVKSVADHVPSLKPLGRLMAP